MEEFKVDEKLEDWQWFAGTAKEIGLSEQEIVESNIYQLLQRKQAIRQGWKDRDPVMTEVGLSRLFYEINHEIGEFFGKSAVSRLNHMPEDSKMRFLADVFRIVAGKPTSWDIEKKAFKQEEQAAWQAFDEKAGEYLERLQAAEDAFTAAHAEVTAGTEGAEARLAELRQAQGVEEKDVRVFARPVAKPHKP